MAPHSSTLAGKIPWMEEPGGLHLPSYLGFFYLGRGVSLHSCSSKAWYLGFGASAGGIGLIPGQENKIPHPAERGHRI